jgi:exosortase/archaeosortase family protein
VIALPAPASFDRNRLLLWLIAIAALNSFAGLAMRVSARLDLAQALFNLFGISAIVWVALAAALALLHSAKTGEPLRRADYWMAATVVAAGLLPVATASAVSLTVLAIYMIASAEPGSAVRRSGIICLAITGSILWGRVLLAMFSRQLLPIDSWLAGALTGVAPVGNMLPFADGTPGGIVVAPGCSSWQGMSLALLAWVTVNQWFAVRFSWRSLAWCVAALAATVAVNVVRIGAMVHFPAHLDAIHHGYGWDLAMWTSLAAVSAICLYGARREVFR